MAKKICNICNIRPVSQEIRNDMCDLCRIEGEWENTHNDDSHEFLAGLAESVKTAGAVELRKLARQAGVKNAGQHKSAELRPMVNDAIEAAMVGCWICHPELNKAQMVAKVRKAPEGERRSRKGQIINVPLRAPGELKAAVVIKAAGEERATLTILGGSVAVLDVNLDGVTLHLAWDAKGRYDYAEAYVNVGGKKKAVRNVAEALRIIKR